MNRRETKTLYNIYQPLDLGLARSSIYITLLKHKFVLNKNVSKISASNSILVFIATSLMTQDIVFDFSAHHCTIQLKSYTK